MSFSIVKLLDSLSPVIITGGIVPRGAYNAGTDYAVGDMVSYSGSSYVMYSDAGAGTLPTNTTYWQLVATGFDVTRFIYGETPTPATDGVETVFTTADPYLAGTLRVTRGSLRMHPTDDFTESAPSIGEFTMVVAPESTEPLIVDYIKQ